MPFNRLRQDLMEQHTGFFVIRKTPSVLPILGVGHDGRVLFWPLGVKGLTSPVEVARIPSASWLEDPDNYKEVLDRCSGWSKRSVPSKVGMGLVALTRREWMCCVFDQAVHTISKMIVKSPEDARIALNRGILFRTKEGEAEDTMCEIACCDPSTQGGRIRMSGPTMQQGIAGILHMVLDVFHPHRKLKLLVQQDSESLNGRPKLYIKGTIRCDKGTHPCYKDQKPFRYVCEARYELG